MKLNFFRLFKNGNQFKFFPRFLFALVCIWHYRCICILYWLGRISDDIVRNENCYKSDFSLDD